MIQVFEENRRPTTTERFNQMFGNVVNTGSKLAGAYQQRKNMEKLVGEEISKLPPEFQKLAFQSQLEKQNKRAELQGKYELENEDYNTISNAFGKQFADIWKAAPTGGKTNLLDAAIETKMRGGNVNELLSSVEEPEQNSKIQLENIPQMKEGNIPKNFVWPEFNKRPSGYTPKEWADTKKTWRSENVPVYNDLKNKIATTKKDLLSTKNLVNLNETRKIGEGFEGSLINPETGDFYGLAQLSGLISPESQQWVKEIARFQNRAKDAFGSRVTNFDLQSYMKQFPGLLNTYEGRRRILRMMDINYKLDDIYQEALNKVYDRYGLADIPQEKAEQLAQAFIKDEVEQLRNDYLELDEQNKYVQPKLQQQKINNDRNKLLDELT